MPRCALIAACGMVLWSAFAQAQPPAAALEPSKVNAARLRWLQYKLVAGRVVATSSYPDGMNISFGPSVIDGRLREHLQLLILKDQASVNYELTGDGEELAIALAETGEFSIRRTRSRPAFAFEYSQPPGMPLRLSVTTDGVQRTLTGDSFWHLYLADPELVRSEVIPYLELLRPSWQLAPMTASVEDALVQQALHPQAIDTERWSKLVEQLGSDHFSERQRSERELLHIGQMVLPYLEDLDLQSLDAEQTARVARLLRALSVDYEDATDRVANWLAGDRQAWLSLLDRPELAKRRAATRQLAILAGGPIDFDPEADEQTRCEQIGRLRERFGTPPPSLSVPSQPASTAER
jgi:hypothetical protein